MYLFKVHDVYSVLYPVHLWHKLLGLTNQTVQEHCRNRKTKTISLQRVIFYLFILLFLLLYNFIYPKYFLDDVATFLKVFKLNAVLAFLFTLGICTRNHDSKLINICDNITQINLKIIENLKTDINDRNLRSYSICLITLNLIFIMLIATMAFFANELPPQSTAIYFVYFIIHDTYNSAIETCFYIYILLLKNRLEILNASLSHTDKDNLLKYHIVEIRRIHLQLAEIIKDFNRAFSLPILCCFVSNFIMIVARTTKLCCFLILHHPCPAGCITIIIMWLFYYTFGLLLIILSGSSLSTKVNKHT